MEGDCHYLEGNVNARRRIDYTKTLLNAIGLEEQRVQMINLSSAMGGQFALSAAEFTETIRRLGTNPLKKQNHEGEVSIHLEEESE